MIKTVEVLGGGFSDGTAIFSERIEGTPQYCTGYIKAIKDIHPNNEVIVTEL